MSREKAAKIAADWWAERWIPDDTREVFRSAVEKRTLEALNDPEQLTGGGAAILHVDYDPTGREHSTQETAQEFMAAEFSSKLTIAKRAIKILKALPPGSVVDVQISLQLHETRWI